MSSPYARLPLVGRFCRTSKRQELGEKEVFEERASMLLLDRSISSSAFQAMLLVGSVPVNVWLARYSTLRLGMSDAPYSASPMLPASRSVHTQLKLFAAQSPDHHFLLCHYGTLLEVS